MKSIYHKLFVSLITIITLLFFGASTALAQGTYGCIWDATNPIGPTCLYYGNKDACTRPGFTNGTGCGAINSQSQCNAASLTCIVDPFSTPNPGGGGSARTISGSCPGGFGASVDTAIGCVPINDQNALVAFFVGWGVGIAGGIALLLIIIAGFMITTSRGDPTRIKAGQELLTSAIAGIVLLIFSIFILRIVGVGILGIPIGS